MIVAHILHNSFENDSRVLKELESLSLLSELREIHLLCISKQGLKDNEGIFGKTFIHRLKDPTAVTKSFIKKGFGFVFWLIGVLRLLTKLKPEILHCHDLTGLIVGFLYKLKNKEVFTIYDCHEFQTEVKNLSYAKKKLLFLIEKICIFYADSFVTVSDAIAKNYEYRYGIKKPVLILNCPKEMIATNEKLNLKKILGFNEDEPLYIYQGSLSKGRGIELILSAFKSLPHKNVVFMGNGPLKDQIKSTSKDHSNIKFYESVPVDEVLKYTSSADVGICLTDKSCLNHIFCLPNKFFEYMNAGVPVICNNLHETNKIMQQKDIGLVLMEESVEELKKMISNFPISQQRKLNQVELSKTFNWKNQEKKLLALYSSIQ